MSGGPILFDIIDAVLPNPDGPDGDDDEIEGLGLGGIIAYRRSGHRDHAKQIAIEAHPYHTGEARSSNTLHRGHWLGNLPMSCMYASAAANAKQFTDFVAGDGSPDNAHQTGTHPGTNRGHTQQGKSFRTGKFVRLLDLVGSLANPHAPLGRCGADGEPVVPATSVGGTLRADRGTVESRPSPCRGLERD